MKKGYVFLTLVHIMVFPISCAFNRNNPMDEGGPNFIPPEISFNEELTSVKDQDTIHFDSVTIVLVGNKEQSLFEMKLDTGEWTLDWQPEGLVGIGGLTDGVHTILINSIYKGGTITTSDTINFYVLTKGFKPEFKEEDDTTIASFGGKVVTLIANAEGASPLKYSWIKSDSVLTGKSKDSLTFKNFSLKDTGSYQCVVLNDYGTDTSRIFTLKFRASTGGIKGIVTDTAEKILKGAKVALSPSDKQVITGSDGKFEFSSLSEDTYTLKITFTGYEDKTVDDIKVNDSDVVDIKGIELEWIDTTTYKVSYHGNDNESGEVPVDSTKYSPNSKVEVLGNTGNLSVKGYTFLKWNTKKDGSGDEFSAEDSFTISDNVTLYAQWKVNKYTVSFNGNSSTSGDAPEDKEYDYNEKVTVPDKDSLKRAGYTFEEWNTQQNGEGKAYAAEDTFSMPDSDVVLYAQWEAMPTYKVTYDKNEADSGTVPVDSDSYYEGKDVTIEGNPGKLFRDGFSFAGWNTKADGTGDDYNAGSKFPMPDSAVTFYVKWSTNPTYSIIYHGNTNSGGDEPSTVESDSGDNVTIADSGSLVKTGYTFVEWNTKADGSGKAYSIGEQVTMDTLDIDLYAHWTKAQYTVTYHGNGSTGGTVPIPTTHLYQSNVTVSSSEPTRTGHNFQGWNTDSTGGGLNYVGGRSFTMGAGDVDLYAMWEKIKFAIIFLGNGARTSNVPNNTEFEYGTKIDSSSFIASRESYIFDGWYMDSMCTNKWVYETHTVTLSDTLYAKWVIKDIDGNIYTEVRIGRQVWMVENLKTTKFRDGSTITRVNDDLEWEILETPAYCWYHYDVSFKDPYGALYNWYTVNSMNLAPEGWHIPSNEEWDTLMSYLGGSDIAGAKLKMAGLEYWQQPNDGTNESGFSAVAGGMRLTTGSFDHIGFYNYLWSASENDATTAWQYNLYCAFPDVATGYLNKKYGFNVRCLRDWE